MSDHVKKWLLPFGALVLVAAIFFVVRTTVSSSTGPVAAPPARASTPVTHQHAAPPSVPPATMSLTGKAGGGRARINCAVWQ
jgi:hypothetical protein